MGEFLGGDHDAEIDGAARAGVVFRIDDGVVVGGRWRPVAGGRDVDGAFGKRVLQHLEHGCVFLSWEGGVVRVVVAEVEVEFDMTEVGV